ncbi:lysosomal aspartic protease-like [Melanaphis sacchari]|uniref:Lysosomal aspartic protease n=2 Tax=Melanaphis sacchari TaxID=742174 RepID=A0A2H8TXU4_9HEMI|nr:lysosomal aspartic protease-like [Melanaphis sacchari]
MKNKLMFLIFFYYVFCTIAEETNIYSMPLIRRKSPLQMLIKDPHYMKKINIQKVHPMNENITLFKYMDSEYYAEILVGKPGQKFTVIFDTTWSDMWIPSKLCSKDIYPICGKKHLYDQDISSSHKFIDPTPFNVDGLVGNLTCDTIVLGHLNVTDLIFAEITGISNLMKYQLMHADGIIGLGYNTNARTTNNTFFYKLLDDKKILNPIFSVYMNRDTTTPKGGTIFLGGIEPKHIKGEITYVPVTQKNYWQIEMNQFSVQINKTSTKTFCDQGCQVILDTSSNKIGVPPEYVTAINSLVKATLYFYNRYKVPCSLVNKLPKITINIGSRDFHISGRHYIQKMENEQNGTICITAFSDSELSDGVWSLGGGFLSSVYTTFDLENNRVGFANLK